MYAPMIKSAETLEEFELPNYNARLLGEITALGGIQYKYILVVFRIQETTPVIFITSEASAMAGMFGDTGSHFLCAFEDGKHLNFGSSNEWADLLQFKMRALAMADSYINKGTFDD